MLCSHPVSPFSGKRWPPVKWLSLYGPERAARRAWRACRNLTEIRFRAKVSPEPGANRSWVFHESGEAMVFTGFRPARGEVAMFDSLEDLKLRLKESGYFIDAVTAQVVFLAAELRKPLLLEGPAGSGKTQLALTVATAAGTQVERLQCYRGVTEEKAIGRFDESLQRLYMEFSKGAHENWQAVQSNLKGRDFFRPGPLMRALEYERPCVLLIDELDKVDEPFEAFLLEVLAEWQLSIPEFGTIIAKSIPFVVLTSNEERRLGDPIRRRCLYVRVEHPTPEREAEIIASRTPNADERFHREVAGIALSFRNYSLEKPPSVSEMIDFARAVQLLGTDHVTPEHRDVLLPFLAKTGMDRRHLLLREGFKSLLDDGAKIAERMALRGTR